MDKTTTETPKKGGSMGMIVGVIAALIIIGIALVMMRSKSQSTQTDQITTQQTAEEATAVDPGTDSEAMAEDSTAQTFEIEAGSFYFKPNEIRVKKGDKVKIVMTSADMMHDFNIDELNVKLPITKSGETNTVEFTADTAGEFEFYCSVGQHRANGQVGTIIVEE